METTFDSSSVNAALTRIKNTLNYSLKENYGIEDPEITERFLHLHGLDKSRFDFINNFETLIEKGIADESVDTNANKCDKSITGFFSETAMPINKLVGYRYLYRKLKELYGKKEAKRLSGEMYDMSLALADSSNILKPYCYSINASKLVMEGRPFGSLPSGIPHRVSSYINTLCEIIHQLSNHTAGALAIASFHFDIAHVMIYREHKTLTDLKNPEYRKYIKNSYQCFVHSMNHLSRNAVESPFTNVSIFDRPKLRGLLGEDNLAWYFDKDDIIDGSPSEALEDCGDKDWIEYIIEVILELEDIFMDVMDEGDKLHNNRPIEFPVSTINFSRVTDENGNRSFADPEFVKHICENHDIVRYNIYTSESLKIASCCFAPNTPLTFINSDGEVSTMSIGDYVETRLDEELGNKDYVQRPLPGDEFINTRHGQIIPITGVIKLQNKWKRLIKITFTTGDEVWCTPDQKFLLLNEELAEAKDLTEGSLLYRYLEVKSVDSYESDEPVYDIEVGSEDHIFKIKLPSGHSLRVENCRLINDGELFELGGQVNSFGGTALSLGSHRVCTVNLRRISLECSSWEDYLNRLNHRMEDAAKVLLAHRSLLKDLIAKGTQPFMENGWLDLDRMFSTFGILGYYEADQDLRKRFGEGNYLEDMIKFIDEKARELTTRYHNVYNVEQIPSESMAPRLAKCDRWLYGEEKVPEALYANQFVPLWEDVTLREKFEREGYIGSLLTGGGIVHFNLGEKVTPKQAYSIIEGALKAGCEHFALNSVYSVCNNDHFTLGKVQTCPHCNLPIENFLTRVVGFWTFTKNWSKEKREGDFERRNYRKTGF